MDINTSTEAEINAPVVARIRTLVGYGADVEDVVARVAAMPPGACPVTARWVRFVARMIAESRF